MVSSTVTKAKSTTKAKKSGGRHQTQRGLGGVSSRTSSKKSKKTGAVVQKKKSSKAKSKKKPVKKTSSSKEKSKKKKAQVSRSPMGTFWWLGKWAAIVALLCAALGTAVIAGMLWMYGNDSSLPKIESLREYSPASVNRVLAADGSLIGELFEERRSVLRYDEIPKILVDAFVSAEDKGFWKHEGIDYVGMMRAAIVNVRSGKKKQGASTITQQVVKNLLLTRERTFRRKFQEIILARRLEKGLSKEEILTLYANEIFFGHGRYGVQEASRFYFGKEVAEINPGEAALLAGLPKGPNRYSPKKEANHKRAKDRQSYVLQEMKNNGYLTMEEAQHWMDEPISVVANAAPQLGEAPEFVELARAALIEQIGEEALKKSGQSMTTTVDLKIQALARKALQDNLQAYDERKKYGRPIKKIKEDKINLELLRLSKRLPKKGPLKNKVYRAIVMEVHDADQELVVDLGKYKTSILLGQENDKRFNPDLKKVSDRFSKGDVVRVSVGRIADIEPKHGDRQMVLSSGPEGAVVIIDIKSREVLAMVGGYDAKLAGFNRATMAKRQAGSTFKPFVYAAAIDSGDFHAASIVNDAPEVYDLWKPENYKKGAFAGPVRLRYALAKSINTVAIRVANDIGPARVQALANALGIQSKLPDGLSLALGSGEVTPLELTNAFVSLAAGGQYLPPRAVEKLGEDERPKVEAKQVLRPEVAYIIMSMMQSVVTEGTGAKAASLRLSLAGKTGTSNNARDAWFVGMSPSLAVGVWIGYDDFRRELGRKEGGSKTALPVFIDIMKTLGKRSEHFESLSTVETVRIDALTGLLAAEGETENVVDELFLPGTAPTEVATSKGEVGADDAILDQYGDFE